MITATQSVFAAIASALGAVNADGFPCGSTFFNVLIRQDEIVSPQKKRIRLDKAFPCGSTFSTCCFLWVQVFNLHFLPTR